MINVTYSRNFKKSFLKLPQSVQDKFHNRLGLFVENPNNSLLNNHKLHGYYQGCMSINITGDYRAVFEFISNNDAEFQYIGTHSQLYK